MSREEDYRRISAIAGVEEHGGVLPPSPGMEVDQTPRPYWETSLEREECPLRPQELEAVKRTADGENTKQIAYTMGITLNQVYWLLRSAKNATGAKRETDLVAKCIRNGWIE